MTNPILEAIRTRRSVRKFKPDAVPQELIDEIISCGTYAASGRARQPWKIIQVTNPAVRERLRKDNAAIMQAGEAADPFYGAPVCLLVIADRTSPNCVYDGSLVMGNMMLAAHALGLGSCWINRAREEFEMPEWKAWLAEIGIEGDYVGIAHLALGYAEGELPPAQPRKPCVYRV